MKSFGFKQLKRKEGPSFYLKGFQKSKCQWGRAKLKLESSSRPSSISGARKQAIMNLPYSDSGSQYMGGSSIY
jgi:hypothetical protein